ncbi:putative ATP-dependent RNA helicase DHX35 isoform 1 [Planoprotostelium fungivorum]|uniref:RNA helicase n=1 Tax=Planoprotostelium fungivorum TaxID=1890364 RepID=A0A2P6NMS4_9EUKA|nr:putative ATP-dependent RNA helicase DHX35 isoform 1 [Planoprotostelium fungivorum]
MFQKPASAAGAFSKPFQVNEKLEARAAAQVVQIDRETTYESGAPVYNSLSRLSISQQRLALPVYKARRQFLYLVEKYQVVVVVGETGSGKTTQLPQYLVEAGWSCGGGKQVGCTQPRRVAATSVATRVAEEMSCNLGTKVGYSIRFDEMASEETVIKYLTDGMLLRECMVDPLLTRYSVIMIDEAHERSLHTDVILGLLKKILSKRSDLRVVVSSATINAQDIKDFFETNRTRDEKKDSCRIMSIEGRTYPVDVHYLVEPVSDYNEAAVQTVLDIHRTQPEGDVLVFLTGQEEIDRVVLSLQDRGDSRLRVLPMYSGLSADKLPLVFEAPPARTRKVIVATNIAETSITIDGIVYVVDCGFAKIRAYNARLGIETLVVQAISQATAKQRAGRAGRNRAGKCYRLFTEEDFHRLTPLPVPEMQRTNLTPVVLCLKSMGIDNILHFDFMTPPPVGNLIRSLEILYSLGALDNDAKLTTPVGTTMAEFPVDPYMAKIVSSVYNPPLLTLPQLLSSGEEYKCSEEVLTIAAMLSVQTVWSFTYEQRHNADGARRKFAVYEGDHLTLLNVYNSFLAKNKNRDWCKSNFMNYRALIRAMDVRNQLKKYLKRWRVPVVSTTNSSNITKCILSGYFANVARLQPDGSYRTLRSNQSLYIHPISVLNNSNPEWVLYHEVVQTNKVYMREVTTIDSAWLSVIAPQFYEVNTKSSQHMRSLEEKEDVNETASVFSPAPNDGALLSLSSEGAVLFASKDGVKISITFINPTMPLPEPRSSGFCVCAGLDPLQQALCMPQFTRHLHALPVMGEGVPLPGQ